MASEGHRYTRAEVVAGGFEARCDDLDGTHYLWHGQQGIRVDPDGNVATLITKSSGLPDGPWLPTELGRQEIAERMRTLTDDSVSRRAPRAADSKCCEIWRSSSSQDSHRIDHGIDIRTVVVGRE